MTSCRPICERLTSKNPRATGAHVVAGCQSPTSLPSDSTRMALRGRSVCGCCSHETAKISTFSVVSAPSLSGMFGQPESTVSRTSIQLLSTRSMVVAAVIESTNADQVYDEKSSVDEEIGRELGRVFGEMWTRGYEQFMTGLMDTGSVALGDPSPSLCCLFCIPLLHVNKTFHLLTRGLSHEQEPGCSRFAPGRCGRRCHREHGSHRRCENSAQ